MAVTLSFADRPEDLQARLPGHVGDDIRELNVHLGQGLLHVLDTPPGKGWRVSHTVVCP